MRMASDTPESPEGCGVLLGFRPSPRTRIELDTIEDYADLGPEHCVPAVEGLGKILRLFRAGRLRVPQDPTELLGQEKRVAETLERVLGLSVVLELKPRSRVRFTAWTENGVDTIDNVAEVIEAPDAYLVSRQGGRFPVRIPRDQVIRQKTECDRWFEILDIERA